MYTDEELEAVTQSLLPGAIPRTYDTLGIRRTDTSFTAIQQAAAGVFLLYPNTAFYFAYLLADALGDEVRALAESCTVLLSSLSTLRRRTIPVDDVSSLSNARAALVDLESVVTSANPPDSLTAVPAYQRFTSNTDRFLRKIASNIRQQAQLVSTPEEARRNIPAQVEDVRNAVTSLLARVKLLSGASANYYSVDLARRVSASVVQNARSLLAAREADLATRTPTERLEVLRQTVLELLAARGVVTKFGLFPKPQTGLAMNGSGGPYSDKDHPAIGAVLEAEKYGPYTLIPGNSDSDSSNMLYIVLGNALKWAGSSTVVGSTLTGGLAALAALGDRVLVRSGPHTGQVRRITAVTVSDVTYDGPLMTAGTYTVFLIAAPTAQVFLPKTIAPSLSAQLVGPYNIQAGVSDALQVEITPNAPIAIPLTAGAARTATQIAANITTALTAVGFKGEAYFLPTNFDGSVVTSGNNISLPYGNFPALFQVGDLIEFYYGPNSVQTRTVTALSPSPSAYNTITVDGAALTSATIDKVRAGRDQSFRIVPVNPAAAISNDVRVLLRTPTTITQATGLEVGLTGEQIGMSILTDTGSLAQFINLNQKAVLAGAQAVPLSPLTTTVRSEPTDGRIAVLTHAHGVGTWPGGMSFTIVLNSITSTRTPAPGDLIVLRGGPNPGEVGVVGAVTDTTVFCTFTAAIGAGTGAFDVGTNDTFRRGDLVIIDEGVNAGRFIIDAVHPDIPFQLTMRSSFPLYRSNFNESVYMVGSVSSEVLTLQDRGTAVGSQISIFDPLQTFFSAYVSPTATGSTFYFQVPEKNRELGENDLLELYRTDTVDPTETRTVTRVEDLVVTLDAAVPSVPTSYSFQGGLVGPVPSAMLRNGRTYDFTAFKKRLDTWLVTRPMGAIDLFFAELNRRVNPLLVNSNPTDTDCADAENQVRLLQKYLTQVAAQQNSADVDESLEVILASYFIDKEVEADSLVRAYRDQGADRAADFLLSCEFTTFFGLNQDGTSYGGALQAAIRDVQREDLPVDKFNREKQAATPAATIEDTDFEYSAADLNENPQVDPPQ